MDLANERSKQLGALREPTKIIATLTSKSYTQKTRWAPWSRPVGVVSAWASS